MEHRGEPGRPLLRSDSEALMRCTQAPKPSAIPIVVRATQELGKKCRQGVLRAVCDVGRIERTQNGVLGDMGVKGTGEAMTSLAPTKGVK
jgi:hypothetical protein